MVQSKAATVAAYLKEADATRRPALTRLRTLIREALADCDEVMDYGMPTYKRDGTLVTAFANQKGYIAFYAGGTAIERHKKALGGTDCGKGCIRYKKPDQIDFDVVRALLKDVAERGKPVR